MSNLAEEHASKKRLEEKLASLKKRKTNQNKNSVRKLGIGLLIALAVLLYLWSWVSGIIATSNPAAAAWIFTTGKIAFIFGIAAGIALICFGFYFETFVGIACIVLALGNFALGINLFTPGNITESGFVYAYDEKTETLTVRALKTDGTSPVLDTAELSEDVETVVLSRSLKKNGNFASITVKHEGAVTVEEGVFFEIEIGRLSIEAESISLAKGAFKGSDLGSVTLACETLMLSSEAFTDTEAEVLTLRDATVTAKKNAFKGCEIDELVLDGALLPAGANAMANGKKTLFFGCDEFALTLRGGAQTAYFSDTIDLLTLSDTSEILLACYHMDAGKYVQVTVKEAVLTEDFSGKLINYVNTGVFTEKVETVALAEKIYIPDTLTVLPDHIFGDTKNGCTVYFEGTEAEWQALISASPNAGRNYSEGRVRIHFGAEHAAFTR
ncbi:MAG: leucine-rich repeat protein [Clostridia bacterium]|nr:leucine-rich repeat protein [Clostridia bacterium]